jgi:glycosyltransferase involved in cell wall biosynthesis
MVPHGVDLPHNAGNARPDAFHRRFPELTGRRLALCMGRVHPIKRFPLVVEALARVRAGLEDLSLVIAGHDAGHLAEVRSTASRLELQDRVVDIGFAEGGLKDEILAAADLFVLPSIHENFGVAVVEAMSHGVPVVVTPGVAAHVYVDQSGGGLTVEGTAEALADAIRRVLEGDARTMGLRGRNFVADHLSWPAVARQLDDMYREAIARAHQ